MVAKGSREVLAFVDGDRSTQLGTQAMERQRDT